MKSAVILLLAIIAVTQFPDIRIIIERNVAEFSKGFNEQWAKDHPSPTPTPKWNYEAANAYMRGEVNPSYTHTRKELNKNETNNAQGGQ